jgi:MATE family multidrug resistance protein
VRFLVNKQQGSTILRLAYPAVIGMLTQTAVNLVDQIMVGRLPAEQSIPGQSAMQISLILMWGVGSLIASIQVGTQALTARRMGEKSPEMAGRVLDNSLLLGTVVSVVAVIGVVFSLPTIFAAWHPDPNVVEIGIEYCTFRMLGVVSMVLTLVMKGFFDGVSRTKVHMVAAITMNAVNIALNYVLIFGVGPFPRMEVAGAGLASLIATYIGLAVMIAYALAPSTRRRFKLFRMRNFRISIALKVIRIGLPGGLASLFVMTGFGVFMGIVGKVDSAAVQEAIYGLAEYKRLGLEAFGADPATIWTENLQRGVFSTSPAINTTATTVIMNIMSVVFMSCLAFGQATATLVGQSLGAGEPDMAERYGWESAKISAYFMGALGLVFVMFPDPIVSIFNPNAAVIEAAHSSLRLVGLVTAGIAVGMVLAQALYGAGCTMYVMVVELILHFVCLIPLAWVLGITLDGGILGTWTAAVVYLVLLAILMAWKFRQGSWKQMDI